MPKLPKIISSLFLCNILGKKSVMKSIFLHADKHISFLEIGTMIFDGDGQALPKLQNFNVFAISQKRSSRWSFLHADKHQSFLQVNFNTLGIKVSYKVILSLLISMIKFLKVLNVASLRFFYNISEKTLGMLSSEVSAS